MGLTAARGQLTNDGFKSTLVVIFFEGVGASNLMEVEKKKSTIKALERFSLVDSCSAIIMSHS